MFTDQRSKKVIIVAHCVLNQNAKLDRCAHYPGAMMPVVDVILKSGAGIIQMPCPELFCLGMDRQTEHGKSPTVAEEDTRIARLMAGADGTVFCREVARSLVFQIKEYQKHGFTVVGLVGINGSPTCGVEMTWFDDQEQKGQGVLIRAIRQEMEQHGLSIAMRGVKAYEPASAVESVEALIF